MDDELAENESEEVSEYESNGVPQTNNIQDNKNNLILVLGLILVGVCLLFQMYTTTTISSELDALNNKIATIPMIVCDTEMQNCSKYNVLIDKTVVVDQNVTDNTNPA